MKRSENNKKSYVGALLLGSIVVIWITSGVIAVFIFAPFENAIDFDDIRVHLDAFQGIADENGGSRSVTNGYNASADYVVETLSKYDKYFRVTRQFFNILEWERTGVPTLRIDEPIDMVLKYPTDFGVFTYSPTAEVTGEVHYVGLGGCTDNDYVNFPKNRSVIALVQRGDCTFVEKNTLAEKYGAKALIIYNNAAGVVVSRASQTTSIPVFGISRDLGILFINASKVELQSFGRRFEVTTLNVLAETLKGDSSRTIVVGSHLDSVPAGPGLNDNASGSSGNLAMALHFARKNFNNKHKIRFAWWGAEEVGLLGSRHYVTNLDREEYMRVALNLNFDMIGSPNYERGIYNASSGDVVREDIVAGSLIIQKKFEDYFIKHKLDYTLVPFNGRSDYGPFIEEGICAGGLATGAEGIKDEAGRIRFGGLANAQFDPCYHQYCDTTNNVNPDIIVQNTNAALVVLRELATNKELIDSIYNSNDRSITNNLQISKFPQHDK